MATARTHINIPVSDFQGSVDFYSKIFGIEPSKLRADYANFRLEIPALHLALVHRPDMEAKPVLNGEGLHFGVELFDSQMLLDWKERVKATGLLPHLEEEGVTCCYAVADKFWLHDPSGNEWEFWVRHSDDGDTLFSSHEATRCCAPVKTESSSESCCS